MITTLYIGEWRADQFGDESVDVISSVLDITDITKNTGDYTKTFTLPASKRNNILFKHWYDATINNSFDARIKVEGRIELDGFLFKKGKWRLSKVSVKKGKPSAYTINFFGNLPSLKDIVKKDLLSDLDLSAFDHDYDSSNVKQGLQVGLFNIDIIYTLFAKKRYIYDNNSNNNTQEDDIANIAYGGGEDTGVRWNDLRASIRILKIIEAIEVDYNLIFSRDFFGTTEFTELYMWLNPDKDLTPGGETKRVDWNAGSEDNVDFGLDVGTFTIEPFSRWEFDVIVTTPDSPSVTSITLTMFVDGVKAQERTGNIINGTIQIPLNIFTSITSATLVDKEVYFEIKKHGTLDRNIVVNWVQRKYDTSNNLLVDQTTTATSDSYGSIFVINTQAPKLRIIDFLKGLFSMFKLVVIAENDGTYFVDTLDSFYASGDLYDVTKYIDFDSYDAERGQILNEIELKFQEPTTILNIQFEKDNIRGYGDIEKVLEDDNGELLDGDTLKIEVPFEQIVYERLTDQNNETLTNIQYGAIIDENQEPVNPKAHIFYKNFTFIGSSPIGFIDDTNTKIRLNGNLWTPYHHYGVSNPNYSTIFNREFSTWDGVAIENTLYKNHYDTYVSNIFNIKKRTFKFSAQLPIHIITKLQLNDALKIKSDYFKIDKYSYNLLTGKTTFSLINNFDRELNPLSTRNENIVVNFLPRTEVIVVNNSKDITPVKIDQGFGTDWVTITNLDNSVSITYDENTTDETRSMFIQYTSGGTVLNIYTTQNFKKPTFDSTTITFDSTKLTFDNN